MDTTSHSAGLRRALNDRALAIAVIAVVSAACFALGFFVGRAISKSQHEVAGILAPQEGDALSGLQTHEDVTETLHDKMAPDGAGEEAGTQEGVKTYSVQVGAYLNGKAAETLMARLRNRGYDAYILKTSTQDGRTIYKVRVGRFTDRREAELMARKVEQIAAGESIVTSN
jgi:hypothetical protein